MTPRFDALIDRFHPARPLSPQGVLGYRFLIGSSLLGLAVATVAVITAAAAQQWMNSALIATFALGLAALLAAARGGASLSALSNGAFALLAVFFVGATLLPSRLHFSQLQWLALLPIVAMLNHGESMSGNPSRLVKRLIVGVIIAMSLAVALVFASRSGWTMGAAELPAGSVRSDLNHLSDTLLFIVSVAGLLWVHRQALQRAQEELLLLRSMMQVCAWCRRIHDSEEGWVPMEQYMAKRTSARLTHGICPDCMAQHP